METQKLEFKRETKTEIFIGDEIISELPSKFNLFGFTKQCAIITDTTVSRLYSNFLEKILSSANISVTTIVLDSGETSKNLDNVSYIIQKLDKAGIDRDCPIIGFGGGVICDITGFTASVYKRGVPLILIPTTLLAMVDASFGGKNAVNTNTTKNLIGSFYQPQMTFMDVSFLATLPQTQLYYGLIEALKHGIINDTAYFSFILKNLQDIKEKKPSVLQRVIRRSVYIKTEYIQDDEMDKGKRAHLNFGHTFGHAIESVGKYLRYNHAEAVGLGMLMAIKASLNKGILKEDFSSKLIEVLTELDMPTSLSKEFTAEDLANAIMSDKKRSHDCIKFILLESPGKTVVSKINTSDVLDFVKKSMLLA